MYEFLKRFSTMRLPDAIDAIVLGADEFPEESAEGSLMRYASRLLGEIGAARVRDIAVAHDIRVVLLTVSNLFWLRFASDDFESAEVDCLLATEAAINRLLLVSEVMEAQDLEGRVSWTEAACQRIDLHIQGNIAQAVPSNMMGVRESPLASFNGASGARGGEWDVRTRFAFACERLRLPFRLAYTFDCNVAEGWFRIDYAVPPTPWYPKTRYDEETGTWVDGAPLMRSASMRYGTQLAALLASIAFGSSEGIVTVYAAAHIRDLNSGPTGSLNIKRPFFVHDVMERIASGDSRWTIPFLRKAGMNPYHTAQLVGLRHGKDEAGDLPVPDDLVDLLCADTADELDVVSKLEGDDWEELDRAVKDRIDSPLAAIVQLEDIVAKAKAPDYSDDKKASLYCSDTVARCLVNMDGERTGTRFERYSDTAFSARTILCDLYRAVGDSQRAMAQAEECIRLAPTSTVGYTDAANTLFEQDQHAQAIPYLKRALEIAVRSPDIAFIYYRLAYALWRTGERQLGLACYVICLDQGFVNAEAARSEMSDLLEELHLAQAPSVAQAKAAIRASHVPLAPSDEVRRMVSNTIVRLVDEGVHPPASRLCGMQGLTDYRDVLMAVAVSLDQQ